ncbi:hypothetical protein BCR44DRAFT_1430212 [Catenaria anguillulae PL171]|uniref:Uncharacterized protein n=1 Tax=Catenaria anguillulae PL171 TaxID=765915 RepID=A0A1Y2HS54_9FUNG|nr:hypothetical protein BCR44DRAFT_1430212 [Catenaria anguillulae PL171]
MVIPSVIGPPATWLVGVKPLMWGADKSLHWILFVAMNEDEVMLPNRQASRQLLITVLGITAAGCLFALAISKSFVSTLADITNKLNRASKKSLATVDLATDVLQAPAPDSVGSRFRVQIAESIRISQAFTTMMTAFATAAADSAALVRKSSVLGRSTASGAATERSFDAVGGAHQPRTMGTVPRSPSFLAPVLRGEAGPRYGSMPRPTTRSPERLTEDRGER